MPSIIAVLSEFLGSPIEGASIDEIETRETQRLVLPAGGGLQSTLEKVRRVLCAVCCEASGQRPPSSGEPAHGQRRQQQKQQQQQQPERCQQQRCSAAAGATMGEALYGPRYGTRSTHIHAS